MEIKNYIKATLWSPLLIIGFLLMAFSGLLMYFHIENDVIKELHENISILFVTIAILHIVTHWRSFKNYFKIKKLSITFVIALIVLIILALFPHKQARERNGEPQHEFTSDSKDSF